VRIGYYMATGARHNTGILIF